MGYECHHALIVTSFDSDKIEAAHLFAVGSVLQHFPEIERPHLTASITLITPPAMNGFRSFMVGPDGSKEPCATARRDEKIRERDENLAMRALVKEQARQIKDLEARLDEADERIHALTPRPASQLVEGVELAPSADEYEAMRRNARTEYTKIVDGRRRTIHPPSERRPPGESPHDPNCDGTHGGTEGGGWYCAPENPRVIVNDRPRVPAVWWPSVGEWPAAEQMWSLFVPKEWGLDGTGDSAVIIPLYPVRHRRVRDALISLLLAGVWSTMLFLFLMASGAHLILSLGTSIGSGTSLFLLRAHRA